MITWLWLLACTGDTVTTDSPTTPADSGTATAVDSGTPTDTSGSGTTDTRDTHDTGSIGGLDVSAWDPYEPPALEVTPVPLVPGETATVTYRGPLAEAGKDLVLHHGWNGWNEVTLDGLTAAWDTGDEDWFVQADMASNGDSTWSVTVAVPPEARALHAVVYDPASESWDNNDTSDYGEGVDFPYIGPYLGYNGATDPTSGVVINWVTGVPCLGTVEFGETDAFGQHAVGAELGNRHHVALTGLSPDTEYRYRVYDSRGRVSDTHSFRTLPADSESLSLLVMGDMQDGGATQRWQEVADEAATNHADAAGVFLVGDMAYNDKPGHWWTFFDRGRELFAQVPLLPVPGNHDTPGTGSVNELDRFIGWFDLPWADGAGTDTDTRWSLRLGPVLLLGFNSEDPSGFWLDGGNQFTWADEALGEGAPWAFAAWHNPPYNVGRRHYLEQHDFRDVTQHFEGRLDWVFSGHEHLAQRITPMRYNASIVDDYGREAGQGVGYLIAPPAGNDPSTSIVEVGSEHERYRDRLAWPPIDGDSDQVDSELGFVRVEVSGESLTLDIYGMGDLDEVVPAHVRESLSYTRD